MPVPQDFGLERGPPSPAHLSGAMAFSALYLPGSSHALAENLKTEAVISLRTRRRPSAVALRFFSYPFLSPWGSFASAWGTEQKNTEMIIR